MQGAALWELVETEKGIRSGERVTEGWVTRGRERIKLSEEEKGVPKSNGVHPESDFHKRWPDAAASSSFYHGKI